MQVSAQEIAHLVEGELIGDPAKKIAGPAKLDSANYGEITFLADKKLEALVYKSKASAILVHRSFRPQEKIESSLIKVDNVYEAMAKLLNHFFPPKLLSGVSEFAVVDESAILEDDVFVGAFSQIGKNTILRKGAQIYSHVTIGDDVEIGQGSKVFAGARINESCQIGKNCLIHSNAVVGSDGFGYYKTGNSFYKIPQLGNVVIEDDVEIGANSVIDRATIGTTLIKRGVKIDNLVQVAHNVTIGENVAMAAQSGVAGSTKIGKNTVVGGQAGIVGHLDLPEGLQIQAQSGVIGAHGANQKLYGSPAMDYSNYLKSYVHFKNLSKLVDELNQLKNRISELEDQIDLTNNDT